MIKTKHIQKNNKNTTTFQQRNRTRFNIVTTTLFLSFLQNFIKIDPRFLENFPHPFRFIHHTWFHINWIVTCIVTPKIKSICIDLSTPLKFIWTIHHFLVSLDEVSFKWYQIMGNSKSLQVHHNSKNSKNLKSITKRCASKNLLLILQIRHWFIVSLVSKRLATIIFFHFIW